jgi:hypothetical protein
MLDLMRNQIEKESLRYSVSRTIFCPTCGRILDIRNAVEVSATTTEKTHETISQGKPAGSLVFCKPYCGECFDKVDFQDGSARWKHPKLGSLIWTAIDGRKL